MNSSSFLPYDRGAALNYTSKWAMGRNPDFYDYSGIGGDCTNFASQVLLAGKSSMNYQPVQGWYYIDPNRKSPSWTSVDFLYNFLIFNRTKGPVGKETNATDVEIGDLVQLSYRGDSHYHHTLVITGLNPPFDINGIYVSAHSIDRFNVNLVKTYVWKQIRFIHIIGNLGQN